MLVVCWSREVAQHIRNILYLAVRDAGGGGGGGTYPPYAIQSEWRVQVLETALALATPVWRIGAGGLDSTSRSLEVSMVAMVVEGGMEMERKGDVGFGYIWRGLLRVLWFE